MIWKVQHSERPFPCFFFLCKSSIFEELRSWLILLDQVIPQEQIDIQTSILAELQKRVVKAEATIGQKEEENAALQEQLQQYEKRWSDYEGKMKAMEEMWQMQMLSLQVSLLVNFNSLLSPYIICFIFVVSITGTWNRFKIRGEIDFKQLHLYWTVIIFSLDT